MKSDVLMLFHLHKDFVFDHTSTWIKPAYTGHEEEWMPSSNAENYINVCDSPRNILEKKKYYPNQTYKEFFWAMGVASCHYYLNYNDLEYNYLGISCYGRYLLIHNPNDIQEHKITVPITQDKAEELSSENHLVEALDILNTYDIITNHDRVINMSIQDQYCMHQSIEHWNKFKEGIDALFPEYRPYMDWFTNSNKANFQSSSLCRKKVFNKIYTEYFAVMDYVWQNVSNTFPLHGNGIAEEFPFRYPGFLEERFIPFFLYANDIKRYNVPLIELRSYNKQVY